MSNAPLQALELHVRRLHERHPEMPLEDCIELCIEQITRDKARLARAKEPSPEVAAAIVLRGLSRIEREAKRQRYSNGRRTRANRG